MFNLDRRKFLTNAAALSSVGALPSIAFAKPSIGESFKTLCEHMKEIVYLNFSVYGHREKLGVADEVLDSLNTLLDKLFANHPDFIYDGASIDHGSLDIKVDFHIPSSHSVVRYTFEYSGQVEDWPISHAYVEQI